MLIKTNLIRKGFDAVTAWPFIFIRPSHADNAALIEHEKVHYREQRRWLTLPWLVAYWLSKDFRFNAEIRGHKAQIAHGGITREAAAMFIRVSYDTGRSCYQIYDALGEPGEGE